MATLWEKGFMTDKAVEKFTSGNDRQLDLKLAKYDATGSKAHISMLAQVGLLPKEEEEILQQGLDDILAEINNGKFTLQDSVEDIHSQIELLLTQKYGDIGRKIHSGRSRNDQVLLDIKLFLKDECSQIKRQMLKLFNLLTRLGEKNKDILMPGYTHYQIAMPSSFGLWFGAYAEALAEDMLMLKAAYKIADMNPLGSSAGYGNSLPLDREKTTRDLGFSTLAVNPIAAQMGRGRCEKAFAAALGQIASTLNKLAQDCCLYMCQNFGFISFPDNLTTGSSIMPQKKNPDVWEMIRGNCNLINSTYSQICLLTANLPHGYHRDFQLLKDVVFPASEKMHECLDMAYLMLKNIKLNKDILSDPKYETIFCVEKVNSLVLEGVPFRQAYKKVASDIRQNGFDFPKEKMSVKGLRHTHTGSLGNLSFDLIKKKMRLSTF